MNHFRRICAPICCLALGACGAAPAERAPDVRTTALASSESAPARVTTATAHDWTRFGWNASRSSAATDQTGITAANVSTLRRQQVALDGTVDASAIYL